MTPITPFLAPTLSPLAKDLIGALRSLSKSYVPHDCGGFNIDDMRWRLGRPFEPDDTIHEAMDELLDRKLIRFAGFDDESAYTSCYKVA